MEDSIIIHKFLDYLKFERRFSEHTAKCYGADLTQFCEFLTGRPESASAGAESMSTAPHHAGTATAVATQVDLKIDQLLLSAKTEAVRAYLAFLNERDYSKATIARKLATLRSFYK
ncbi:MAG: site-specific integrase, partial [Planctomycetota bacterium]